MKIRVQNPGNVILCVNNKIWIGDAGSAKTEFLFELGGYLKPEEDNSVEIYFTGEVHPFLQNVEMVTFE